MLFFIYFHHFNRVEQERNAKLNCKVHAITHSPLYLSNSSLTFIHNNDSSSRYSIFVTIQKHNNFWHSVTPPNIPSPVSIHYFYHLLVENSLTSFLLPFLMFRILEHESLFLCWSELWRTMPISPLFSLSRGLKKIKISGIVSSLTDMTKGWD